MAIRMFIHGSIYYKDEHLEEIGFWIESPGVLPIGSSVEIPLDRERWSGGWGNFVEVVSYELDQLGNLWCLCGDIQLWNMHSPELSMCEVRDVLMADGATHYLDLDGQHR